MERTVKVREPLTIDASSFAPGSCGSCRWAKQKNQFNQSQLCCTCDPPTAFGVAVPQPGGVALQCVTVHPVISATDGCSKWQSTEALNG